MGTRETDVRRERTSPRALAARGRNGGEPCLADIGRALAHRVDLRRLGWALAAVTVLLLALGALSAVFHQQKSLLIVTLFDASRGQAIPPLVSGGLLAGGGLLALGVARGRRVVAALGWLMLALALDEAIGLHDTVQAQTGLTPAALWMPVVIVAALLLAGALPALRDRRVRLLFGAGALLWFGAQLAELLLGADPHDAARYGKEVVELGGAVFLLPALLLEFRALTQRPAFGAQPLGEELVRALPLRRVAAVLGAVISTLVALALAVEVGEVNAHVFRMNNELTWAAFASAGLLLAAGSLASGVARLSRHDPWAFRAGAGLAFAFSLLAVDEVLAIHEALGRASAAVDEGQLFLLPLVPFAAAAWLVLARRLHGLLLALWVVGAGSWTVAVAVDTFHPPLGRVGSVVIEDTLELVGSASFVLALLGAAQRRASSLAAVPSV